MPRPIRRRAINVPGRRSALIARRLRHGATPKRGCFPPSANQPQNRLRTLEGVSRTEWSLDSLGFDGDRDQERRRTTSKMKDQVLLVRREGGLRFFAFSSGKVLPSCEQRMA